MEMWSKKLALLWFVSHAEALLLNKTFLHADVCLMTGYLPSRCLYSVPSSLTVPYINVFHTANGIISHDHPLAQADILDAGLSTVLLIWNQYIIILTHCHHGALLKRLSTVRLPVHPWIDTGWQCLRRWILLMLFVHIAVNWKSHFAFVSVNTSTLWPHLDRGVYCLYGCDRGREGEAAGLTILLV